MAIAGARDESKSLDPREVWPVEVRFVVIIGNSPGAGKKRINLCAPGPGRSRPGPCPRMNRPEA